MSGSTSPILGIPQIAPTQNDKTTTINDAILAFESALQDQLVVDMSGGDVTLTAQQYTRFQVFSCTGLTAARNLIVPQTKRVFIVKNTSPSYAITVKAPAGSTVSVAAGTTSEIQNDATNCTMIAQGGQGTPGNAGGLTIDYTFNTATTNADPGSGQIALNNGTQGSATALYVDVHSTDGTDYTAVLDNLTAGGSTEKGLIRLFNTSDPTKWIVLSLTGETTHTGYREFAVTVIGISGANPFGNGDAIALTFARTGDAATSTTNVWTAAQRAIERTLTYGATVTPDFSTGNNFVLTLTGNATIANPTNLPPSGQSQSGQIVVIQDGTGGHTLTWGSEWYFTGGIAVQPASEAGGISIYSYHARGSGPYILLSPGLDFQHT